MQNSGNRHQFPFWNQKAHSEQFQTVESKKHLSSIEQPKAWAVGGPLWPFAPPPTPFLLSTLPRTFLHSAGEGWNRCLCTNRCLYPGLEPLHVRKSCSPLIKYLCGLQTRRNDGAVLFLFLSFGVGLEREFSSLKTSDALNQPNQSILCGTVALWHDLQNRVSWSCKFGKCYWLTDALGIHNAQCTFKALKSPEERKLT